MARGVQEPELGGLQKAAILLIALGPERSATIFKHLKEEEIEDLTLEIANTRSVTPQVKEDVINEFYGVCLAQQYIAEGGISYAKELLEKALGNEKALDVIGKLTASLQVKPFEFIRKTEASQLLNFIQDEHPQTIALILSYLNPGQAALIISQLDKLPMFSARRKEIVAKYNEAFKSIPSVFVQQEIPESDTTRHLYILRIIPSRLSIDRAKLFEALKAENVCCNVHYIPTYYFPYYEKLGYKKGLCPNAEKLYSEMLSLPLYYGMSDEDVDSVIAAVMKICEYYAV